MSTGWLSLVSGYYELALRALSLESGGLLSATSIDTITRVATDIIHEGANSFTLTVHMWDLESVSISELCDQTQPNSSLYSLCTLFTDNSIFCSVSVVPRLNGIVSGFMR